MVVTKILPLKEVYTSIDWPVIILLAAMIPVGTAFETMSWGILYRPNCSRPV
jgi:di/tricarboxylate transporter